MLNFKAFELMLKENTLVCFIQFQTTVSFKYLHVLQTREREREQSKLNETQS